MLFIANSLSYIFIFLISSIVLFIYRPVQAIDEYQLLQEGYDLYLACEPAKASEKFRSFLKEFPVSSAKDTALFWLGKALMQMGELTESEKAFMEIRKDFPNSPFSSSAGKEIERIRYLHSISRRDDSGEARAMEAELVKLRAERDRLKTLLDEEKKKIVAFERRIAEIDAKEKEFDGALREKRTLEERLRELEKERQKEAGALKAEIELLSKRVAEAGEKEAELRKEIDAEKKKVADYSKRLFELEANYSKALKEKVSEIEADQKKMIEEREGLKAEREKLLLILKEREGEIESLRKKMAELGKREDELRKAKEDLDKEVIDLKRRMREVEEKATRSATDKVAGEVNRLKSLLSEEKKRCNEAYSEIINLKEREKELLKLNASLKGVMEDRLSDMGQRLQACEKDLSGLQKEKSEKETRLARDIESLREEITRLKGIEASAKDLHNRSREYEVRIKELEKEVEEGARDRLGLKEELKKREEELSRLKSDKKELESLLTSLKTKARHKYIVIGNERFSLEDISSYMFKSQLLMSKIGIRNVPWRGGDLNEDFINEQLLYEEAKKLDLEESRGYEDLNRGFSLSEEEVEYLNRFKIISNLIIHELKRLPPERSGEAVVLRYSDKDRYEKAEMVADLQNRIKSGLSIKEAIGLYHDTEYKTLTDRDIIELFGDLSNHFSDNEVAGTFNRERFMVVRIKIKPLWYSPFEPPEVDVDKGLKEYIQKLLSVLRSKREIRFSD